jgi:hypothetical protein
MGKIDGRFTNILKYKKNVAATKRRASLLMGLRYILCLSDRIARRPRELLGHHQARQTTEKREPRKIDAPTTYRRTCVSGQAF